MLFGDVQWQLQMEEPTHPPTDKNNTNGKSGVEWEKNKRYKMNNHMEMHTNMFK